MKRLKQLHLINCEGIVGLLDTHSKYYASDQGALKIQALRILNLPSFYNYFTVFSMSCPREESEANRLQNHYHSLATQIMEVLEARGFRCGHH